MSKSLAVLLVPLSLSGCLVGALEEAPPVSLTYWYTMLSTSGEVILTNQFAVAKVSLPEDELWPVADYVPNVLKAGGGSPFGDSVDAALREAAPGRPFMFGPVNANETLTGTNGTFIEVPRWRGPFPINEAVSTVHLRERFPSVQEGDVVPLNPRFAARVVDMGPERTQLALIPGGPRDYSEFGPEARLRAVASEDGETLRDLLEVPVGATFRRPNDRVAGVPQGWYGVVASDNETITLAALRSPLLEFAFQDVVFILEVVEKS